MRRVVFIIVMCAFAFVATPVLADLVGHNGDGYDGGTANWDRQVGYYAGQGGEFTIWGGSGLKLSNSAYADSTSGLKWDSVGGDESFQSFCIETAETIYEPMEIWVSEGNAAGTGFGSHAWKGGTGLGDDLDAETAYLYTQFATGQLDGYNYGSGGYAELSRSETAGALQRLIWYIEGEGGSDFGEAYYGISLNDDQRDLIEDWGEAFVNSGWTGIGDVRVLQTYKTYFFKNGGECFELKQDQLYLTPVPGAVLLGVLGLGVAGLKLRRFA